MRLNIKTAAIAFMGFALFGVQSVQAQQFRIHRGGYLGIRYEEVVTRGDENTERVIVREISAKSPAEKAGLKAGDEILRINDLNAANGKFSAIAGALEEGDTVRLRVRRDGKEGNYTIIAGARPQGMFARNIIVNGDSVHSLMRRYLDTARVHLDSLRFPNVYIGRDPSDSSAFSFRIGPNSLILRDSMFIHGDSMVKRIFRNRKGDTIDGEHDRLFRFEGELGPGPIFRSMDLGARSIGGAELTVLDPAMKDYFKADRGLLTLRVAPETPADRAGLQPGDVVVKAKGRVITTVSDLRAIVQANPDGVTLEIVRKGDSKTIELKTRSR